MVPTAADASGATQGRGFASTVSVAVVRGVLRMLLLLLLSAGTGVGDQGRDRLRLGDGRGRLQSRGQFGGLHRRHIPVAATVLAVTVHQGTRVLRGRRRLLVLRVQRGSGEVG